MTPTSPSRFRIVTCRPWAGCDHEVHELVPFLFFWKRWKCTHLCNDMREAEIIVKYLQSKLPAGTVVRTYE